MLGHTLAMATVIRQPLECGFHRAAIDMPVTRGDEVAHHSIE